MSLKGLMRAGDVGIPVRVASLRVVLPCPHVDFDPPMSTRSAYVGEISVLGKKQGFGVMPVPRFNESVQHMPDAGLIMTKTVSGRNMPLIGLISREGSASCVKTPSGSVQ